MPILQRLLISELANAIRVAAGDPKVPLADQVLAQRLFDMQDAAVKVLDGYLGFGQPPQATGQEAIARMVGHMFDNPYDDNPLINSGAQNMVSPWRIPQGTIV